MNIGIIFRNIRALLEAYYATSINAKSLATHRYFALSVPKSGGVKLGSSMSQSCNDGQEMCFCFAYCCDPEVMLPW